MECLRLSHKNFSKGRITLEFANALTNDPNFETIKSLILEAEEKARNGYEDNVIRGGQDIGGSVLEQAYKDVVDIMSNDARNIVLKNHCNQGRVVLIAPETSPYNVKTAPIHKVMLAVALYEGIVDFKTGRVETIDHDVVIATTDPERGGESQVPLDRDDFHIARIGPDMPISDFLTRDEILGLEIKQTIGSNHSVEPEVMSDLRRSFSKKFNFCPNLEENPWEYYLSREYSISDFFHKSYGCGSPEFVVEENRLRIAPDSLNDNLTKTVGGLSSSVFGISTVKVSLEIGDLGTKFNDNVNKER